MMADGSSAIPGKAPFLAGRIGPVRGGLRSLCRRIEHAVLDRFDTRFDTGPSRCRKDQRLIPQSGGPRRRKVFLGQLGQPRQQRGDGLAVRPGARDKVFQQVAPRAQAQGRGGCWRHAVAPRQVRRVRADIFLINAFNGLAVRRLERLDDGCYPLAPCGGQQVPPSGFGVVLPHAAAVVVQ